MQGMRWIIIASSLYGIVTQPINAVFWAIVLVVACWSFKFDEAS